MKPMCKHHLNGDTTHDRDCGTDCLTLASFEKVQPLTVPKVALSHCSQDRYVVHLMNFFCKYRIVCGILLLSFVCTFCPTQPVHKFLKVCISLSVNFGTVSLSSWSPPVSKTSLSDLSIIVSAQELIQACLLVVQQRKGPPLKQRQSTVYNILTISTDVGVYEKFMSYGK